MHFFVCGECKFAFDVQDGDTSYNDDPQTRDCPECKDAKGDILYIGSGGGAHQIISDYINGPMGAVQNQADGKMYDSKSQYYKAVKAAGCVVMGNDTPKEAKGPTANICEKELKRDIAQAINQLGG